MKAEIIAHRQEFFGKYTRVSLYYEFRRCGIMEFRK